MRISDWSSDVCSSDLMAFHRIGLSPVKRRNRVLAAPGPPSTTVRGLTIMATESVVETPAREAFDCASVASVGMKDDFYLEFGVPSRCRSEEHTSELQSLMRISYAVSCLKTNTTHDARSDETRY